MDAEIARQRYEREHDPSRVLTLTDGVVAIIITLLVLEIHVPELSNGESLTDALQEVRPSFFAFFISFVVVAISWAGHRDLFALIRRTDRLLVWLNVLYLLPLCIIPFGASMLARYEDAAIALQMYGALLLAVAATRLGIWWYATGRSRICCTSRSTPRPGGRACGSSWARRPPTWRASSSQSRPRASVA